MDQIKVQIIFSIRQEGQPTLNDALWMTLEEFQQKTPEEIEQMKQERYQNWLQFLATASEQQIEGE